MNRVENIRRRVAVVKWTVDDGIASAIYDELGRIGYWPNCFRAEESIPAEHDIVFSFAPYGRLFPLVRQLESFPPEHRPFLVHWNTEGLPDLRIPWQITHAVARGRAWVDRAKYHLGRRLWRNGRTPRATFLDRRMLRFRYVGDYRYAAKKGVLDLLADSSAIYAELRTAHGMPTLYAPWGSSPQWYADLNLERDIDVLWMGNRRGRRRRRLLDRVRNELQQRGVEMYMADDEENPYIFDQERTSFLNRAKITLNLTRTWYDDNFSRFAFAAPNRSLIVSEPLLRHCPPYKSGIHYVEGPRERLTETILEYLEHPGKRAPIVENAYRLTTSQLTLNNTVKTIMNEVERIRQRGHIP